jgi:hypothetical protein
MRALAILIQTPCIDFSKFLSASHEMFGYSPSAASDASHRQLNDTERFLSCLASMKDKNAPLTLPPHLLTHVLFSVLVATDERDMMDVLECCSSMAFTVADTLARGVQAAVISGTLSQWKTAVLSGCDYSTEQSVRFIFNKILILFETANLNVWQDFKKTHDDNTLYLEGPR